MIKSYEVQYRTATSDALRVCYTYAESQEDALDKVRSQKPGCDVFSARLTPSSKEPADSDDALVAAARALHANSHDSLANSTAWEDLTAEQVAVVLARTRAVVNAFKPALAEAWEAGRHVGRDDIQLAYNPERNPYA